MIFSLEIDFIIVSFLASLTAYFRKGVALYLKGFPFFLLITIIVEEIATYQVRAGNRTTGLYNIFSVVGFCFYFFVLGQIVQNPKMKTILLTILILFPVVGIWNILYVKLDSNFITVAFSLGSLLVVGVSIYYFIELFQLPKAVNLLREPAFWICTGLIFFFTCLFPFYGFINFMNQLPRVVVLNFNTIITIANVFMYSLFSIAFLCQLRIRNFM